MIWLDLSLAIYSKTHLLVFAILIVLNRWPSNTCSELRLSTPIAAAAAAATLKPETKIALRLSETILLVCRLYPDLCKCISSLDNMFLFIIYLHVYRWRQMQHLSSRSPKRLTLSVIHIVHSSYWNTCTKMVWNKFAHVLHHFTSFQQVAQLSQRDRAAGWVSYGQKWKTVNGRQYFRT